MAIGTAIRTITNNAPTTSARVFSGVISGGSGGGLTFAGTGLTELTGTNTYTGATTITGGTMQLGNGGTTRSLSPSSAISILEPELHFDSIGQPAPISFREPISAARQLPGRAISSKTAPLRLPSTLPTRSAAALLLTKALWSAPSMARLAQVTSACRAKYYAHAQWSQQQHRGQCNLKLCGQRYYQSEQYDERHRRRFSC